MPTNGHTNGHGYTVPEATATLVLDKPPYAGAEIECRLSLSPAVYFGVKHWLGQAVEGGEATMVAAREIGTLFNEYGLNSWNLVDPKTHKPKPATLDGVLSLDVTLIMSIAATWVSSIGTVPVPLPEASTTGSPKTPRRTAKRSSSTASGPTVEFSPSRSTSRTSAGSDVSSN